jgi:large subunit ribosomal protein L4
MKLSIKDLKGGSHGELDIQFALVENGRGTQAVHDTIVGFQAAQRSGTACTKNVGEVAGSNKKPWRQKGTGRARAGSFRSPLWRGGGVVFGPKPRDFRKKVSKSTRKLALRKALSERLNAGDVTLLADLALSAPRTKDLLEVLSALQLEGHTVLLVSSPTDKNLFLASRNISYVELTSGEEVNTYQVLRHDKLVFTRGAFEKVEQRLKQDLA